MDSEIICNPQKITDSLNNVGLRDARASKNWWKSSPGGGRAASSSGPPPGGPCPEEYVESEINFYIMFHFCIFHPFPGACSEIFAQSCPLKRLWLPLHRIVICFLLRRVKIQFPSHKSTFSITLKNLPK